MDRTPAHIERRVAQLMDECRAAGLKITPQRLAVYRALLLSEDHPTPEALYQRVRPTMPSLSLATIYKALDALEELGVVDQLAPETKRYDANQGSHHHLVCTRCGRVSDFYDASFDALKPSKRVSGFRVRSLSVQLKGLCEACAAADIAVDEPKPKRKSKSK